MMKEEPGHFRKQGAFPEYRTRPFRLCFWTNPEEKDYAATAATGLDTA